MYGFFQDQGIYRCRVDYRNSPTKNVKLNLSIIVPPDDPIIRNQNGAELSTYEIGPYEVGQNLILDCQVSGGKKDYWQSPINLESCKRTDQSDTQGCAPPVPWQKRSLTKCNSVKNRPESRKRKRCLRKIASNRIFVWIYLNFPPLFLLCICIPPSYNITP